MKAMGVDEDMAVDKAMVVDANNLMMQAIFATQSRPMSANGRQTGPVNAFIASLGRWVRAEQPSRLMVVWDGGKSVQRLALLPGYKANRTPQPEPEQELRDSHFELVREFLALAGVPSLMLPGYEADDLVAAAWTSVQPAEADEIVILSGDHDFLQLVGPNPNGVPTTQIQVRSGAAETYRWNEERVLAEHGVSGDKLALIAALAGDKGDNVPGIPRVGPVKAKQLLEEHDWDLDAVGRARPEHADMIKIYYKVVDLRHIDLNVHVPLWRPTQQDSILWDTLLGYLDTYRLLGVRERLAGATLWRDRIQQDAMPLSFDKIRQGR